MKQNDVQCNIMTNIQPTGSEISAHQIGSHNHKTLPLTKKNATIRGIWFVVFPLYKSELWAYSLMNCAGFQRPNIPMTQHYPYDHYSVCKVIFICPTFVLCNRFLLFLHVRFYFFYLSCIFSFRFYYCLVYIYIYMGFMFCFYSLSFTN